MGGGAAACPQPFFWCCRIVGSDCTLPCVFCWRRAAQPPSSPRYAGCLTPKALPPPFRAGFVAALLSIERQHPKVIHRVSSRATWRSANARTGIRLLGLRLGFMLSTWIHDSCNSCGVFMTCGNCGSKYSKALPLIYSLVQVLKNEFWPHFHVFLTLIVRRLDFHPTAKVTSLSFLGLVLHMT